MRENGQHLQNRVLLRNSANILLDQIVSKTQFLNFRLMPHLVVGGHICMFLGIHIHIATYMCVCV